MLRILTLIVFVLVAGGTLTLWLVAGGIRRRALRRLAEKSARPEPKLQSYALIWQELLSRFGRMLAAAGRLTPSTIINTRKSSSSLGLNSRCTRWPTYRDRSCVIHRVGRSLLPPVSFANSACNGPLIIACESTAA